MRHFENLIQDHLLYNLFCAARISVSKSELIDVSYIIKIGQVSSI